VDADADVRAAGTAAGTDDRWPLQRRRPQRAGSGAAGDFQW